MNDDEYDESLQKAKWDAKEWAIRSEEAKRRTRLEGALGDCRKIVESTTSGAYREYILRSSRRLNFKRKFKSSVNIEEQLADEFILRALFGFILLGSEGNGEELRNVTTALREWGKYKVIAPEDSEIFRWARYIDFKKYHCPKEDLDKILKFIDSIAYAYRIIHASKLTEQSKGRLKIRVGPEWRNLKFVCYTVAIKDTLDLLEKDPDLAEKRIGTRFQKPFDNPRPSNWIEMSGIPRASFYRYWHPVMKMEDKDVAYLYSAVTILPTAFHQTPEPKITLTKKEKDRLNKIRSWGKTNGLASIFLFILKGTSE